MNNQNNSTAETETTKDDGMVYFKITAEPAFIRVSKELYEHMSRTNPEMLQRMLRNLTNAEDIGQRWKDSLKYDTYTTERCEKGEALKWGWYRDEEPGDEELSPEGYYLGQCSRCGESFQDADDMYDDGEEQVICGKCFGKRE